MESANDLPELNAFIDEDAFDDTALEENEKLLLLEEGKYKSLMTKTLSLHKDIKISRKVGSHPLLSIFKKREDKQLFLLMFSLSKLSSLLVGFKGHVDNNRYIADRHRINGANAGFNIKQKTISKICHLYGVPSFSTMIRIIESKKLLNVVISDINSYTTKELELLMHNEKVSFFDGKPIIFSKEEDKTYEATPEKLLQLIFSKDEFKSYQERNELIKYLNVVKYSKSNSDFNLKDIEGMNEEIANVAKMINETNESSFLNSYEFSIDILPRKYVFKIIQNNMNDILLGESNSIKHPVEYNVIHNIESYLNLELKKVSFKYESKLKEIETNFPNFIDVTKYIKTLCDFSIKKGIPLDIPNLLIHGPSGTGKTTYVKAMADAIGIANKMIPMSSLSTSMEITGIGTVWGNAEPGLLIDLIAKMKIGNPIIILDEMDKTVSSGGNVLSPDNALIALTEKETSKNMLNTYFKSDINLSHINWIGTANELNDIKPVFLNRFKSFYIAAPNKQEKSLILNNIYRSILKEHDLTNVFVDSISSDIIDECSASLRESKEILTSAIMKRYINPMRIKDEKLSLIKSDMKIETSKRKIF